MKSRVIGLLVLIGVIITAFVYSFMQKNKPPEIKPTEPLVLSGYLGGEKIGLFEDSEVKKVLKEKYNLTLNYQKAGSLDMITAKLDNMDYLFPSSQTALELYNNVHGKAPKSDLILNTPVVLYSHKVIAEAFVKNGVATMDGNVYYMDILKLTDMMEKNTKWSDIGLNDLYGQIAVGTTDPTKSNSGNMFAGLLANMLNGGSVAGIQDLNKINPQISSLFKKLGYMETSSADIFDQFLRTGMGAKPIIAGYENQLLEFAVENSEDWKILKDDIVIIYPTPTVWSTHIYIALDEKGKIGIDALRDPQIQELAWKKHGFRTGVSGVNQDTSIFGVEGVAPNITKIIPMPDVKTMDAIIKYLEN